MVVRKNISLEPNHIKKLESLISKHNGNLSAAIRDAIDITDASLHRYGSVEEAISKITSDKKNLTGWEESIESGRNVLLSKPIFMWMLKSTKGIPLENEIFEEVLDPLKITTISELDKKINKISRESGWNCQVSLFSMDDINPATATVTIAGDNELYRDFVAHLVIMFLAINKWLDIEVVHKRANSTRIDLKCREKGTQPVAAMKYFGYLKDAMGEFKSREEFWKNLVEIYSSVNYHMVSIYKGNYEELLASNSLMDAGIFESISKKHIGSIPHQDFLKLLKKTEESLLIIDKIEILENGINIYHNYKNEKAIQNIRDYYISLMKANGHEYKAKYSTSLIVLNHICCNS
jgi:molybdopterin converting factor small subunit